MQTKPALTVLGNLKIHTIGDAVYTSFFLACSEILSVFSVTFYDPFPHL